MRTRQSKALFIFFIFSTTVSSVIQASSDGATTKKRSYFLKNNDNEAKTVKNGVGVGKNCAFIDEKNWATQFISETVRDKLYYTLEEIRSMNEKEKQALMKEDDEAWQVFQKILTLFDKSSCENRTSMKKKLV